MYPAQRLYFCPKSYPPPSSIEDMDSSNDVHPGFERLRRDLCVAALAAGNPICSNGRDGGMEGTRAFRCTCWRRRVRSPVITSLLRLTTLVNNEANRRKGGRSLTRATKVRNTSRLCPFQFRLSWDHLGFYVNLLKRSGEGHHRFHPKPSDPASMLFPSRLLTQQEKESIHNVTQSSCVATARNFVFKTFGKFIHRARLAYLDRRTVSGSSPTDDVTRMLEDFEKSRLVKFTTVSDVPLSELSSNRPLTETGTITLSTTKTGDGSVVNTPVSDIPKLSHLSDIARHARITRKLDPRQYLFMAIAWTMIPCLRYFLLCPEVLWFDVTSHSNNKGFCLLTFSCRTSLDKQVVFLRIWIPNKQRTSFRWVFQHALSSLLPLHARRRVRLIMKDGDLQQRKGHACHVGSVPKCKRGQLRISHR